MFCIKFISICGNIHGHGDMGGGVGRPIDDGVYIDAAAGGGGGVEYGMWRLSKKDFLCGCWNMHRFLLH